MRKYILRTILVLVLIMAVGSISCGGDETEPTATPAPTADAQSLISQCGEKMRTVESFHFELEQTGQGTPIIGGLDISRAICDIASPGNLKAAIDAMTMNMLVQTELVSVDGETFMTNPLTSAWEPFPSEFNAVSIFEPETDIASMVNSVLNLNMLEDEEIDGSDCYHFGGEISSQNLRPITVLLMITSDDEIMTNVEVWVDKSDSSLRQVKLTGPITTEDGSDVIRTIVFSGFGQDVEIELPE